MGSFLYLTIFHYFSLDFFQPCFTNHSFYRLTCQNASLSTLLSAYIYKITHTIYLFTHFQVRIPEQNEILQSNTQFYLFMRKIVLDSILMKICFLLWEINV